MTPLDGKIIRAFGPPLHFYVCANTKIRRATRVGYDGKNLVALVDHDGITMMRIVDKKHLIFLN